ncbi:hypothetical protein AVEN_100920-1 [Araneus ventricosus]|uniref:Uncharacterized protein n=1 Tax=Araneus ventricosus TaxID=182803 RepID=A0A4Y2AW30_ARAVE|nr:hypothetical protein AVEN_100920-1 [Araneus ventricosus]
MTTKCPFKLWRLICHLCRQASDTEWNVALLSPTPRNPSGRKLHVAGFRFERRCPTYGVVVRVSLSDDAKTPTCLIHYLSMKRPAGVHGMLFLTRPWTVSVSYLWWGVLDRTLEGFDGFTLRYNIHPNTVILLISDYS